MSPGLNLLLQEANMQIPPFSLDEWLNEYHFGTTPPAFDLASSTGPPYMVSEILGLMTPDERELFNNTSLVYSAATGSKRLRQAIADLHGASFEQMQIF